MQRPLALTLALAGALLSFGCPPSGERAAKPKPDAPACTTAYAQCKLSPGSLGVCNPRECRSGEASPCFTCVSQH